MAAAGQELGETAGPAGGVQGHARLPAAEVLGDDRLVGREQAAARIGVIAGRLLLVGGDGADARRSYAAAAQALIVQQPPDLGQPGLGERAVVLSGPGVEQRDALQAEQVGERVLIDHGS